MDTEEAEDNLRRAIKDLILALWLEDEDDQAEPGSSPTLHSAVVVWESVRAVNGQTQLSHRVGYTTTEGIPMSGGVGLLTLGVKMLTDEIVSDE